jgi:D-sedoheptulose 7-phosphate isomerase
VFVQQVAVAASIIHHALNTGNKVLTCGNGGSAAEASHLAEELLGRYKQSRRPLAGISLCSDGQALTCIANDFGFENVFARQVEALGNEGDILVAFTTSGKSENINRAIETASRLGLVTIALTGENGGQSAQQAQHQVAAPSQDSARVQELHTFVVHAICEQCEGLV